MKQRFEVPLKSDDARALLKGCVSGLTPEFFGIRGLAGVRALYINDYAAGGGVEVVFELRGRSFPLATDARKGEFFVVSVRPDGIRIRRETGESQLFLNCDGELFWEVGENAGLMSEAQRALEFVFKPPATISANRR